MAESLSPQEKIALIHENLQEVLKPEIIENVIIKENRPLCLYWGRLFLCAAALPQSMGSHNASAMTDLSFL